MAIEIGELETRIEAAPPQEPGARRAGSAPDPRTLGGLLRRHLARRARLQAD
jgi:hypothetical protein